MTNDSLASTGLVEMLRAFIGQSTALPVYSSDTTGDVQTVGPVDNDSLFKALAIVIQKTRRHPLWPGLVIPFDAASVSGLITSSDPAAQLAAVKSYAKTMDGGADASVTTTTGPFFLLCDGTTQNGVSTPDYLGRSPIGVTTSVPSNGSTPRTIISRQALGAGRIALTADDVAPHTHLLTNSGGQEYRLFNSANDTGAGYMQLTDGSPVFNTSGTIPSLAQAAANEPVNLSNGHENIHPVVGQFFLVRTNRIYRW